MKLDKKNFVLYAVTDRHWLNGRELSEQVEEAIKGGATFVQLREKTLNEDEFIEEAIKVKKVCDRYNVPFVINDNVDICLKVNADGVHVGQNDMEAGDVRAKLGDGKIIGVSAHSVEEALTAQSRGADYLGVGAAFVTNTKGDAKPLSHDVIKAITEAVDIPVVAIGGISKDNLMELKGTGIDGVAVVSAIFAEKNIEESTGILKKKVLDMITDD